MPSKDTIPYHLTKNTAKEIERIRDVVEKELGVRPTKKQGEIILRTKALKGKILENQINDILLGKIK